MLRISRGQGGTQDRGVVGIHLVLVIGLALVAMVALTQTYIQARRIADNAQVAANHLRVTHTHTSHLALLDRTDTLARAVAANTRGLNAEAHQVTQHATDIDHRVRQVQQSASTILNRVPAITSQVSAINATLAPLQDTVDAIRTDASGIDASLSSTLGVARSINTGVAGINHRALAVFNLAKAIGHDLTSILAVFKDVLLQAHSIDCSSVVSGQACH